MKQIKQQKLKTVLFCTEGHQGSDIVFNLLRYMPEIEIIGIVYSSSVPTSYKKLYQHFRKMGWRLSWLLFWQHFIQRVGSLFAFLASMIRRDCYVSAWQIVKEDNIPIIQGCVNSKTTQDFIKSCKPDLILSAYFHQIIERPTLNIPKIGILNIHPGLLPDYRGAMSYFWALKNEEDLVGVSLHWIDEGIDTGKIIDQQNFKVKPHMTQHQVMIKTAILGSALFRRTVKKILKGKSLDKISIQKQKAAYYSLPTEIDFDHYFAKRRFFRIRDVLSIVGKKVSPHQH